MFKNLLLYRIAPDWAATLPQLEEALARQPFTPCGNSQPQTSGWVPPRGEAHGALVEAVDGQWLLRLQAERKLVPGSVVRDRVDEMAQRIEADTGRAPGKKARRDLKDQALLELLPMAFTKRSAALVWIAPAERLLALDVGRQALADEILTLLTECLPGFAAQAVNTALAPATAMADWLREGEAPAPFTIDRDCELKAPEGEKPAVRYARHPLDIDEIRQHIDEGKRPTRLALTWNGRVSFVLTEGLQLRKLAFEDGVFERRAVEAGQDFNADAAIATGELAPLIGELLDALGGEEALPGAGTLATPRAPAEGAATVAPRAPAAAASPAPAKPGSAATPTSQGHAAGAAGGSAVPPWEAAA